MPENALRPRRAIGARAVRAPRPRVGATVHPEPVGMGRSVCCDPVRVTAPATSECSKIATEDQKVDTVAIIVRNSRIDVKPVPEEKRSRGAQRRIARQLDERHTHSVARKRRQRRLHQRARESTTSRDGGHRRQRPRHDDCRAARSALALHHPDDRAQNQAMRLQRRRRQRSRGSTGRSRERAAHRPVEPHG
jgi:hypothetical protein